MTTQSTIDKLMEMRLTSMSDAFLTQMEDPKMREILSGYFCCQRALRKPSFLTGQSTPLL